MKIFKVWCVVRVSYVDPADLIVYITTHAQTKGVSQVASLTGSSRIDTWTILNIHTHLSVEIDPAFVPRSQESTRV